MAQKTEKEETEFKVVVTESSLSLCINNNCGFAGTPATENMCQKCFNASSTTTSPSSSSSISAAADILTKFSTDKSSVRSTSSMMIDRSESASEARFDVSEVITRPTAATVTERVKANEESTTTTMTCTRTVNRCSGCRRKVGLTGFRCRCGDLYCSEHRYSDRHECSYDYKAAGRDAIERENPVVKAAKIIKL